MQKTKKAAAIFRFAAIFNVVGAGTLALMPSVLQTQLRMPEGGSTSLYGHCTVAFILVFAWMYWRVASDPKTYRPFIEAGIVGKLAIVSIALIDWGRGAIGPTLPLMVMGDLLFALAFMRYLASGTAPTLNTENQNGGLSPSKTGAAQ